MPASYTAVVQQSGDWWIGWVEEVPGVNSQGQTREELLDNLRDALEEALEMNPGPSARRRFRSLRRSEPRVVKRHDLIRHLRQHGCVLIREGRRHSWWAIPPIINGPRCHATRRFRPVGP